MHWSTTQPPAELEPWLKELGVEELAPQLNQLGAKNVLKESLKVQGQKEDITNL